MRNNAKNKRWSAEDDAYVRQHLGKISLENMAFPSLGISKKTKILSKKIV